MAFCCDVFSLEATNFELFFFVSKNLTLGPLLSPCITTSQATNHEFYFLQFNVKWDSLNQFPSILFLLSFLILQASKMYICIQDQLRWQICMKNQLRRRIQFPSLKIYSTIQIAINDVQAISCYQEYGIKSMLVLVYRVYFSLFGFLFSN